MQDGPLTIALILLTGITSYLGFNRPGFMEKYIFSVPRVRVHKEYYRLLSSSLLHADWTHFAFNAITLYFFGSSIELQYGLVPLLLIYVVSIAGGSLLSLLLHRRENYRALGASGGVCGVLFAHIFLFPGGSIYLFFIPIPIPSWLYGLGFLGGSIYAMRHKRDNIGHDAHVGGALVGLLVTTLLYPRIIAASPLLYAGVWVLAAGLYFYLFKHPDGNRTAKRTLYTPPPVSEAQLDALLDKVSREGLNSLTASERALLKRHARQREG